MFEDIYRMIDAVQEEATDGAKRVPTAFKTHIPSIEMALMRAFVQEAIDAMDRTPEYSVSEAEPLRKQLIQNLSAIGGDGRPIHVRVTDDGKTTIFDRDFAGTAGDFQQARYASPKPQSLRYRFWKYGIYARDVTGNYEPADASWFNKAVDKLPSYSEIISERLDIWGNKAPYWYFIEYGTTGGGKSFPSFPGTFFIMAFKSSAAEAVRKLQEDIIREFADAITDNIQKAAKEGKKQIRISDTEILAKSIRRNGNILWQKHDALGRFASGPTFKE